DGDRAIRLRVRRGDEAGARALAAVAVLIGERARRSRRRRLGLEDELAHEELAVVERRSRSAHAGGALAVRPGGRQLRRDQAEMDAVRVRAPVTDGAHDLPLVVLARPVDRAAPLRREGRIVVPVRAAEALGAGVTVVAAVRPRIARVSVLVDVVVAGLRIGRVHDPTAARDLADARAEPAEDVDEERRHDEAGLIAASLRAARDAPVGISRDLAP